MCGSLKAPYRKNFIIAPSSAEHIAMLYFSVLSMLKHIDDSPVGQLYYRENKKEYLVGNIENSES